MNASSLRAMGSAALPSLRLVLPDDVTYNLVIGGPKSVRAARFV